MGYLLLIFILITLFFGWLTHTHGNIMETCRAQGYEDELEKYEKSFVRNAGITVLFLILSIISFLILVN